MPRKKNLMINFPCFCACPIKLLFNGTGINVSLYVLKKKQQLIKGSKIAFSLFVKAYGRLGNCTSRGSGFVHCVVWQPVIHMPSQSLAV